MMLCAHESGNGVAKTTMWKWGVITNPINPNAEIISAIAEP